MVSAILLTAALSLGQVTAYDGPPRQWVQGVVNGQTQWVWGWTDANGWVRFHQHEQPAARRPAVDGSRVLQQPLSPGQTINADGTLNNGLLLNATAPTGMLETNDPDLARKIEAGQRRCSPDQPDGPEFPDAASPPDLRASLETYAVPLVCGASALMLVAAAVRRRRPPGL